MEIAVFISVFSLKFERGLAHLIAALVGLQIQLHLKSLGFSQKHQAELKRKALLVFLAIRTVFPVSSDKWHVSAPSSVS